MASDFISGRAHFSKVYFSPTPGAPPAPWLIKVKSTRIQEVAVEVADGVCGELRDRLQKITNFYRVTHVCFDDGQSSILENWIANQQNEDNLLPQLQLGGGILFRYLTGGAAAFTLNGCTMGPVDYDISGRTERNLATIMYRCTTFSKTAAA